MMNTLHDILISLVEHIIDHVAPSLIFIVSGVAISIGQNVQNAIYATQINLVIMKVA